MHSNVIRELQNNSLITKYKLFILLMHGNCNCMAPVFLEVAQHQLVVVVNYKFETQQQMGKICMQSFSY